MRSTFLSPLSPVLFVLVFFLSTADAAVLERDWLTPGDGLLTFDDVNEREWLDLSETILDLFPGSTLEEKFQSVVAETAPGGMFADFTVAKGADAEALALSAGIDITTGDFTTNEAATTSVINLLGVTFSSQSADSLILSEGVLDETDLSLGSLRRLVADLVVENRSSSGFISTAGFSLDPITFEPGGVGLSNLGVMLYRQAIPEPCTFLLCIEILALFAARRQFRSNPEVI